MSLLILPRARRRALTRRMLAGAALATAVVATPAAAQPALLDSLRPAVERAVVRGDWAALDAAAARLRAAIAGPAATDAWTHYDLGYVLHRRAGGFLDAQQGNKAKPVLAEADKALEKAQALGAGMQALALRGAVNGQIAGSGGMIAGMRNGPRAFGLLDEAVAKAPNDARVALLNGMTRLNAPKAFGGGPAKAEPELRRAITLFANDKPAGAAPAWGRADAHIWLAITLEQAGRKDEARAELQKALALAPGHAWVTGTLLPRLDGRR